MERIKIIIAEDAEVLLDSFVETFSGDPGLQVVGQAKTASGIIQIASKTDFDIALLDIDMERRHSGIYAACQILNEKPGAKIVFLTVHEDDDTIFKAMEAGAVDYIIKSDDTDKIIKHIKDAYVNVTELEHKVQHILNKEFLRLRKKEADLIYYIKNIAVLTPVEKSMLKLLLKGKTPREISEIRNVEITTVKTQITRILKKFNASRTRQIVNQIREMNLENLLDEF